MATGYNVDVQRLLRSDDLGSAYQLRAQRPEQVPQESWFTLGRLLTSYGEVPVLLSWAGSIFKYLMPMLVMPRHAGTLFDQTFRAAAARQIDYGKQLGLPWACSSPFTARRMRNCTTTIRPYWPAKPARCNGWKYCTASE